MRRLKDIAISAIPEDKSDTHRARGRAMADHADVEYATAEGNDYAEHNHTYALFTGITKWSVITSAIILVLMWIFLV